MSREDYDVDLEYNSMFAIVHLPIVSKLTKTVYLDMKGALGNLDEFLKDMGYPSLWAAISPQDTSICKLAEKLGFEFKGTAQGYNVYERNL